MSLYNALFGVCEAAGTLLKMIGVEVTDVPRFRDCYIQGDHIVIYARCGGRLREDYMREIASLRTLPSYLSDQDQQGDDTYIKFTFCVPPEHLEAFALLKLMPDAHRDPAKLWKDVKAALDSPVAAVTDPLINRALEVMRELMAKVEETRRAGHHQIQLSDHDRPASDQRDDIYTIEV